MIVDTSALVAVVTGEPEAAPFHSLLGRSQGSAVSAGNWVELATVLVRKFQEAEPRRVLDALAVAYKLAIVPVTSEQVIIAASGYATYGRGTGHPARLNFGDCFSYALAKAAGEPLLFNGDDFTHTDVEPALRPT